MSWRLADGRKNDHQHRKHDRLQQKAETACHQNEVGGKQRGKLGHKKAARKLIKGGPSKISPTNTKPCNPIHKAAQAAQKTQSAPETGKSSPEKETLLSKATPPETSKEPEPPQHEINKAAVIIGVVGLAALIFMAAR